MDIWSNTFTVPDVSSIKTYINTCASRASFFAYVSFIHNSCAQIYAWYMAYVLSHVAHVWRFTQKSEFAPVIQVTSRGGRPFSVHQYTYGEAVRSVMKREVEVKVPARAEGPRSKYFALNK